MNTRSSLRPAAFAALFLLAAVARADTAIEQAAAALKAGDPTAAETLLLPLATTAAPDAAALHLLSQVRLAQKRAKEAVELADQAVKVEPTRADYHAQLGMACSVRMGEIGFMQQAMLAGRMRKAFEKAVELDPQNLSGLIGLCRYFANAPEIAGGSLEKAKEFALRVQALNPYLGGLELGNVAERGEQFADALAAYETVVAVRPNQGWPQFLCGRVLAQLGRKDDARARFEKALALDPQLEAARKAIANLDAPSAT